MIIVLLVAWVLGGLLVALVVGSAVRIADTAGDSTASANQVEVAAPATV